MTDIGVGDSPHIMSVIRTAPTQLGDIDVGDRFGRASVIQSEGPPSERPDARCPHFHKQAAT
ncbi:hypothetical protein [Mycobacteroides abscessus]|uniref:hypothetical protein n=1 Tax=Mycobacteroides abscessus TaxID=36809 RepID=UPI0002F40501|nr:hypothetical protein [Mycobacteroides abscessus]